MPGDTLDAVVQKTVQAELDWEPMVEAAHIGVAVHDGIVTLTGHVPAYAQKAAAERAARRVRGVHAIVDQIRVELPAGNHRSDEDIAGGILNLLRWHDAIPLDVVQVTVERGHVTLCGGVDWQYQKDLAEHDVRHVRGVRGVSNLITVNPPVKPVDVKARIEAALKRHAEIEAAAIAVSVNGGVVTLTGKVKSWFERGAAEKAAWSAPGVSQVVDKLRLSA